MAEVKKTRGISRETRGVATPKFKPTHDKNEGLNLATVEVRVDEKMSKEDTKQTAFIGLEVPQLVFVFKQADADGVEPAQYIHSFRPIDYTDDTTTEEAKDNIEEANMEMMNHFMTVMSNRSLTDAEYDSLALDFGMSDVKDAEGNLIPFEPHEVEGKVVLEQYRKVYTALMTIIQSNKKLVTQRLWLKLLLYIKNSIVRGGAAAIPLYVGDGFIEMAKSGVAPTLSINIAKRESITPRVVEVAAQAGAAPVGAPPVAGAAQVGAPAIPQWADEDKD